MFRFIRHAVLGAVGSLVLLASSGQQVRAQPQVPPSPMPPVNPALPVFPTIPFTVNPFVPWWVNPWMTYNTGSWAWFKQDPGGDLVKYAAAARVYEEARSRYLDNYKKSLNLVPATIETREEVRSLLYKETLQRYRTAPTSLEITNGTALNGLLVDVQKVRLQGVALPRIEIDADVVAQVNVTSGSGRDREKFSILLQEPLPWPALLQRPEFADERRQLERMIIEVVHQRTTGSATAVNWHAPADLITQLQDRLDLVFPNEEAQLSTPGEWMEARRFLRRLNDGLRALQYPDAHEYLAGHYKARGKTVPELVEYMTTYGLKFAPEAGGHEAAYVALHRALAECSTKAAEAVGSGAARPAGPVAARSP
jgi:hypothetical protein